MFLAPLTDAQKRAFMALAALVIDADERVTRQERALMASLRAEMGMPDAPEGMDIAAAAAEFADWAGKVRAMLELIGIARADCDFDKRESEVIRRIAEAFGITPGKLEVMDDWVFRQLALVREANYLITEFRED